MAGRPWFKHFASASEGSLGLLIESGQQESVFLYWLLLELLCQYEDPKTPGQASIPWRVLVRRSGFRKSTLLRYCAIMEQLAIIRCLHHNDLLLQYECPKWLELQKAWGGKRWSRFGQDSGRSKKKEDRRENKAEHHGCVFDLELIYQSYPLKKGKSGGIKIAKREIKTQNDYDRLMKAVKNYAAEVLRLQRPPEYTKQFDTFMRQWHDWVDFVAPATTNQSRRVPDELFQEVTPGRELGR